MSFDELDYKSITVEDQRPLCLIKKPEGPHDTNEFLIAALVLLTVLWLLSTFGTPPKNGGKCR